MKHGRSVARAIYRRDAFAGVATRAAADQARREVWRGRKGASALPTPPPPESPAALEAARRGAELLRALERDYPELAGRRVECRALSHLRRTGWRPDPDGRWRSPHGLSVDTFERAAVLVSRERNAS